MMPNFLNLKVCLLVLLFVIVGSVYGTHCPNGKKCPDKFTCCLQLNGEYGCCPYEGGMCCKDRIHCCPKGLKCNVKNRSCDGISPIGFKWMANLYPQPVVSEQYSPQKTTLEEFKAFNLEENKCPDGRICPSDNTCCKTPNRNYGCCPFPHASCCTDLTHCCPKDYTCNTTLGTCDKQVVKSDGILKFEHFDDNTIPYADNKDRKNIDDFDVVEPMIDNIIPYADDTTNNVIDGSETSVKMVCPDKESSCTKQETCCKMTDGTFGCCPYAEASCCSDGEHCCPHGYKCDDPKSECIAVGSKWLFEDRPNVKPATQIRKIDPNQKGNFVECKKGSFCEGIEATCCDNGRCCPRNYECSRNLCKLQPTSWMFFQHDNLPSFKAQYDMIPPASS